MPKKLSGNWVTTSVAAEQVGISSWQLLQLRPELKSGTHYLIVSRKDAKRRNYRWNVEALRQALAVPLEKRG